MHLPTGGGHVCSRGISSLRKGCGVDPLAFRAIPFREGGEAKPVDESTHPFFSVASVKLGFEAWSAAAWFCFLRRQ